MNLDLSFLLFDSSKPAPSIQQIILYTIIILIVSNISFIFLCRLAGFNAFKTLDKEQEKEYSEWKRKKIPPWSVFAAEIFNSTLYSPLAEELVFRILVMKIFLVKTLNWNIWLANFIQALLFGFFHIGNLISTAQTSTYTLLQILSAFITGVVSGWVFVASNSILPSLLSHIINNATASINDLVKYSSFKEKEKKL